MSPIVVGANNSPATIPQRYDWGFEKTILYGFRSEPKPPSCAWGPNCSLGVAKYKQHGVREDNDSQTDPDCVHIQSMLDHRSDNKLARRTAQHSNALRDANCRCKVARGESVRGEVNGAREREG